MNFGKYTIVDNLTHAFKKESEWTWTIKPPTSGDELEMSRFIYQNRVTTDGAGVTRQAPPTSIEIAYREIALTFGGTTIPGSDKQPILKPDASVLEVEACLRQMPHDLVMEIWGAVGDATLVWGPAKNKKEPAKEGVVPNPPAAS
jgi:hypothetical protein